LRRRHPSGILAGDVRVMNDARARPRILFMSDNDRVLRPTLHILRSLGAEIAVVGRPEEALTWLRIHRADLTVVELGDAAPTPAFAELCEVIRAPGWSGGSKLLALARSRGTERLRALFERGMSNFLGVGDEGEVDPGELAATVRKILSGDVFGLDKYMAPGARTLRFEVLSSRQKADVVPAAEAFAAEAGCHQQVAEGFATAIDEALTNALYNAPVDGEGRPLYAHYPRTVPVDLGPGLVVEIALASDGRRLGMASVDPFGSLSPAVVLDYLSRCFAQRAYAPIEASGGAGLGLYQLFHLVQHFVINVAPGRRTEVIGLLEVGPSFKRFAMKPKSFNLFVSEAA